MFDKYTTFATDAIARANEALTKLTTYNIEPVSFENKIVALPLNGMAPDNTAIAAHLRELAEYLEHPAARNIDNAIVLFIDEDGQVERNCCGKRLSHLETIAWLTIALHSKVEQFKTEEG